MRDTVHRRAGPLLGDNGCRVGWRRGTSRTARDTYVSLLIAQGEDPRYIADQVGHATTRLTTDLYAHVFNRVRVDAMKKLGAGMAAKVDAG